MSFVFSQDLRGSTLPFHTPSDKVYSLVLTATTDASFTIPDGYNAVAISCTGSYYVAFDTAATIPSGVLSTTASELNGAYFNVAGYTTVHIISSGTPTVTLSWYKVTN